MGEKSSHNEDEKKHCIKYNTLEEQYLLKDNSRQSHFIMAVLGIPIPS